MSAQLGSAVLLQYGTQGAQQIGSAVLLNYDAGVEAAPPLVAKALKAPWRKSAGRMRPLNVTYPSAVNLSTAGEAEWGGSEKREAAAGASWVVAEQRDRQENSPWAPFGRALLGANNLPWIKAAKRDDQRTTPWGAFGDMLNEDQTGRWNGSKPADQFRTAVFGPHRIQVFVPVDYVRPFGDAANFFVVGGSPMVVVMVDSQANTLQPMNVTLGALGYVPHFTGDPLRGQTPKPGHQAHFLIDSSRNTVPLMDHLGNPVFGPSSRDSIDLVPWGKAKRSEREQQIPWVRYSRPLNPGWGVVTPGGPPVPEPGQSIIIPVKRVYIVVNEILFARVDDSTPIPATNLSIAFDADSWLPTFTATIPEAYRDAVMPDPNPVEVLALINGSEFRFFVEKVVRNRQFAQRSVTISGRGLACELDAPYAEASQHTNASAMTVQQIIDAALAYSTYTQTWGISDWLVPAGAFSLHGTPAAVAGAVAEASGAVLAADWATRDLRMMPRYPVKPWEWATATPEYVIPAAVTQTESVEWVEKPAYNVVYVSGVQTGVIGQVKITGSAGDKPAPMVTHPLITHADAARQRGIAILSDTGRKAVMQISLPVLPATGVIDICRLVEFSDGANTRRGIVRANQVSVQWPTVRQTLTIEAAA